MDLIEVAIWFAVWAFLAIRVAMLVGFVALPVVIVTTMHRQRHSTA